MKMQNNYKIILIILVFIFMILYLIFRPAFIFSEKDISNKISSNYLDKQGSLSDYKINSSKIFNTDEGTFVETRYDVKPKKLAYNDWNAGDGEEGNDGWLVDKSAYIHYHKIGFMYITIESFTD
ncbi:hypothetical protein [Terrisporobacter mayombei]|uniref:Uncharacterized protein n=1 Tax=Terrisporobacter mayombei TaxID=1541 RepID=A0ABY9PYJ9_9FIRM|nr:hypothetical protein [Terrisporobacter mayombei]MCC3868609.1 hypothetical protein [Terrisporobacter mayombei]WMT80766.1 hypothetical protein TEMA_10880 [Terrisporobacter mayombei]